MYSRNATAAVLLILIGGVPLATAVAPGEVAAQTRPVVVIDPGHGGDQAGVQYGELLEKDLVLRIALTAGAEFVAAGYDVRFTRTGDVAVAWADRRALAEDVGAGLLIMLHINGDEDESAHGAEIYANLDIPGSARAAGYVAEALEQAGSAVVVEGRDPAFLASPTVPTVMIELAFMTHPVERRLLQSRAFHHELGRSLVSAADKLMQGS